MHEYRSHPIYGIGIPGLKKEWHCRGLIFDAVDKVTELKKLECADLIFATKSKAEAHGLKLCKSWIDEQTGEIESTSLANSAPAKDPALAFE